MLMLINLLINKMYAELQIQLFFIFIYNLFKQGNGKSTQFVVMNELCRYIT